MNWIINFEHDFETEFDELNEIVQDECFAHLKFLAKFGPELGRPHVDTLKGSKHANMKELRFNADNGVWRLAFGVWLLHLIQKEKLFYSCAAINRVVVKNGFIKN